METARQFPSPAHGAFSTRLTPMDLAEQRQTLSHASGPIDRLHQVHGTKCTERIPSYPGTCGDAPARRTRIISAMALVGHAGTGVRREARPSSANLICSSPRGRLDPLPNVLEIATPNSLSR